MAKTGKVYISKKVNVYDLLDDGDTEKLMQLIEQEEVMEFDTDEFTSQFLRDLETDLSQLKTLQWIWSRIKTDPKLNEFKYKLTNETLIKDKKAIVFTESTETAQYLYENLKDIYQDRIIYFSGQSSSALKTEIEESFNPKFKNKNNDKYDLLITTDVLSEGINLHRANVLINYDLPWNPTKIMQRVGRINRVGTEHERIYVFNFFPTSQSKDELPLEELILQKLQVFHDTLGEDFKYLSDDEEVTSQKLFSALNSNLDEEEESSTPELAYLAIIRQIRDNEPSLFNVIKHLPRKAKTGKISQQIKETSTITFIRKGTLKTFFISNGNKAEQLTFLQAIELIQSEPDTKRIPVSDHYYKHFEENDTAFETMLAEEENFDAPKTGSAKTDKQVIKLLKAIKNNCSGFTDEQDRAIDRLLELWQNGEIPIKISKEILKKEKELKTKSISDIQAFIYVLYFEIIKLVPPDYFKKQKSKAPIVEGQKQVILSCYLKGGINK